MTVSCYFRSSPSISILFFVALAFYWKKKNKKKNPKTKTNHDIRFARIYLSFVKYNPNLLKNKTLDSHSKIKLENKTKKNENNHEYKQFVRRSVTMISAQKENTHVHRPTYMCPNNNHRKKNTFYFKTTHDKWFIQ